MMRFPLWAYGIAIASVLGVAWIIRTDGYRDGQAAARAQCSAEQARQAEANRNAIDAANKRLVELADELTLKELQVDDYVKAIDRATAEDPRGADQCLDPDGVRRLNTLR